MASVSASACRMARSCAGEPGSGGSIRVRKCSRLAERRRAAAPARSPAARCRRPAAACRPANSPRELQPARGDGAERAPGRPARSAGSRGQRRRGAAGGAAHAARPPSSRWRSRPVSGVDDDDGQDDQHQQRGDVVVVEFADRLDQVLADAAGADEAQHRGAADIHLEAQQGVAREARQHLRHHGEARHLRPAGAGGARALHRLHVDVLHHLGEQLAERAQRVEAMASTPGSGPSPKAMTKIRAKTISGTVRQNSSSRASPPSAAARRARCWRPRAGRAGSRRAPRAACRHRPSAACRRAGTSQCGRPQNHSAGSSPDPLPGAGSPASSVSSRSK